MISADHYQSLDAPIKKDSIQLSLSLLLEHYKAGRVILLDSESDIDCSFNPDYIFLDLPFPNIICYRGILKKGDIQLTTIPLTHTRFLRELFDFLDDKVPISNQTTYPLVNGMFYGEINRPLFKSINISLHGCTSQDHEHFRATIHLLKAINPSGLEEFVLKVNQLNNQY